MEADEYKINQDPMHTCLLSLEVSHCDLTKMELSDLRWLGCAVDLFSVTEYKIAHIMGIHFRSGEWGQSPRCGSVMTCLKEGRSVYARINRFLHIDGDCCPGYASVTWFGAPHYPCGTPLVVYVDDDGSDLDSQFGCIIRITEIDPSRVITECGEQQTDGYYVMRDSGFDSVIVS